MSDLPFKILIIEAYLAYLACRSVVDLRAGCSLLCLMHKNVVLRIVDASFDVSLGFS